MMSPPALAPSDHISPQPDPDPVDVEMMSPAEDAQDEGMTGYQTAAISLWFHHQDLPNPRCLLLNLHQCILNHRSLGVRPPQKAHLTPTLALHRHLLSHLRIRHTGTTILLQVIKMRHYTEELSPLVHLSRL